VDIVIGQNLSLHQNYDEARARYMTICKAVERSGLIIFGSKIRPVIDGVSFKHIDGMLSLLEVQVGDPQATLQEEPADA
jgi:hypothetical protein